MMSLQLKLRLMVLKLRLMVLKVSANNNKASPESHVPRSFLPMGRPRFVGNFPIPIFP